MKLPDTLLIPDNCALVLIDHQAGLAFGAQSMDRQVLLNNTLALVRTALAFDLPIIVSTSATKVYSGPLLPALRALLPEHPVLDRRNMNVWEDDAVREAILKSGRKNLLFSGMLTEACISLPVLCVQQEGLNAYVVADACAGLTDTGHEMALRRMAQAGARMTSWLQVLLELQRDWTRHDTYDAARAIVEGNGGGYGIGLNYARDML
ncbi:isochorismatase family protein [Ideonella azotifigens]|uniref:Hydrolase n=1 Tax=Ideonella azotifigens TaxID=513160 RepID=A0ABP3VJ05_9BURK|nr:isochorismatase family protein [Ideonella azotifigens]MCD2338760.1 isochorismatase family protein [Ideonella azotifigens]